MGDDQSVSTVKRLALTFLCLKTGNSETGVVEESINSRRLLYTWWTREPSAMPILPNYSY